RHAFRRGDADRGAGRGGGGRPVTAPFGPGVFGELRMTVDAGGTVLHGPRRRGPELEIEADETPLRDHVRFDERGRYRPLTGARSLRRGWRVYCGQRFTVEQAIDIVYPLAVEHRRLFDAGQLALAPLETVLQRQGGRYGVAGSLPPDAGKLASEVACG